METLLPTACKTFDTSRIRLEPLANRQHDMSISSIMPLSKVDFGEPFLTVASNIIEAKKNNASIVLMMGAHVLRSGVQNYLLDMMNNGYISCIAMNGAGVIHDYELSLIGATTESVARYIKDGKFGLWKETGRINDIVSDAFKQGEGIGLGQAVGRVIELENFPYKHISILAAGFRLNIPITIHVGIGYDIVYEFPNCSGAAYGETSYRDFLKFAHVLESLENGVVMNFGSAVMSPEVFLKALSMVRNVANQYQKSVSHFTTLVCDLIDLPNQNICELPKTDHNYYFRPFKTMLVRTVSEGGKSFYAKGFHSQTIPKLWSAINELEQIHK